MESTTTNQDASTKDVIAQETPSEVELKSNNIPLVSIIMSTHNRADHFLPQAIRSVLAQSMKEFELIIVDDASTDNTKEVVESFNDPRIVYISLTENFGKDTRPKNMGVKAAKADYIAYCDDDCEYLPNHIQVMYDEIIKGHADVVYSDMILYDMNIPAPHSVGVGISVDFDPQMLMYRNYIDTSEVMHTKDAIYSVGGWDETLPRFVDWNLWVRMSKSGKRFQRVPRALTKYWLHENNSAAKHPVKQWKDPEFGILFEPTFDTAGCYIYLPYLGDDNEAEKKPKVAIFTLSYDRMEYTKRMAESMFNTAKYDFDWFVLDQGSKDGSVEYLKESKLPHVLSLSETNLGISKASNNLVDCICNGDTKYQIIIKVDNDCEFLTEKWLKDIVDLWKRNHMVYVSPYPEGLVHNPGGAPRVGHAHIGPHFLEITMHIGGFFAAINAPAYKDFRWTDKFKHGSQDMEASIAFRKLDYMPCYMPFQRIVHMDNTEGQKAKYPEYFERRKKEKTEVA